VGLALLLGVTIYATSSVLVQPFNDDLGGTLPALNVPGPKLWAIPLLQRPIGRAPQWPGVVGTRVALLSLLAIWLITAPHPDESHSPDARGRRRRLVRQSARWGAVLPFGVAFGILLTTQGLWPAELPSYRMLLVSCVELPAAAGPAAHIQGENINFIQKSRRGGLCRPARSPPSADHFPNAGAEERGRHGHDGADQAADRPKVALHDDPGREHVDGENPADDQCNRQPVLRTDQRGDQRDYQGHARDQDQ
jgi:hypothetical protein